MHEACSGAHMCGRGATAGGVMCYGVAGLCQTSEITRFSTYGAGRGHGPNFSLQIYTSS